MLRVVCMATDECHTSGRFDIRCGLRGPGSVRQSASKKNIYLWIPVLGNIVAVLVIPFVGNLSDKIGRAARLDQHPSHDRLDHLCHYDYRGGCGLERPGDLSNPYQGSRSTRRRSRRQRRLRPPAGGKHSRRARWPGHEVALVDDMS